MWKIKWINKQIKIAENTQHIPMTTKLLIMHGKHVINIE